MIEQWIKLLPSDEDAYEDVEMSLPRDESIDPRLVEAIQKSRSERYQPLTPVAAIIRMVKTSGGGKREAQALRDATAADFERELPNLSPDDLRRVFRRTFEWIIDPAREEFSYLNNAAKRFVEACRSIVMTDAESRLAQIIRREFQAKNIENRLDWAASLGAGLLPSIVGVFIALFG